MRIWKKWDELIDFIFSETKFIDYKPIKILKVEFMSNDHFK